MLEFNFYWNGQECGVVKRRGTFEVGHADGMHARPCALLFSRLRNEAPRSVVKLRVVGDDAEYLECRSINALTSRLKARRGDRIEVLAKADTADVDQAEKALTIAREVIEATDTPTHWETGEEMIRAGHPFEAQFLQMLKVI